MTWPLRRAEVCAALDVPTRVPGPVPGDLDCTATGNIAAMSPKILMVLLNLAAMGCPRAAGHIWLLDPVLLAHLRAALPADPHTKRYYHTDYRTGLSAAGAPGFWFAGSCGVCAGEDWQRIIAE